ncbi:MAG: DUF1211 domain-containing protein [Cyclobacteriaceae bacterium]|nr:DUF1211 domain-containing protein [Cyclobacteriaceae bacterium]
MINRFPNDRVNNFSDAIFAIAITLLVLEVKVPPTEDLQTVGTIGILNRLIPSFIGLLISFFVTALYWRAHLTHAQFIKTYDNSLLWLTIWLLLFVVMLPFSTGFYSKNFNYNGPFIFYCVNMILIGLFNYLIVRNIIKKDKDHELISPIMGKWFKFRASIAPIIWLLSIGMVFINPSLARWTFFLIFLVLMIGDRRFKKKSKKLDEARARELELAKEAELATIVQSPRD